MSSCRVAGWRTLESFNQRAVLFAVDLIRGVGILDGFLELLRKLGVLRFGTTRYRYSSGKDMPASAIMDDVYDEKLDLVGQGEPDNKVTPRDDS